MLRCWEGLESLPAQNLPCTLGDRRRHICRVVDEFLHLHARCRIELRLAFLDLGAEFGIVEQGVERIEQEFHELGRDGRRGGERAADGRIGQVGGEDLLRLRRGGQRYYGGDVGHVGGRLTGGLEQQ